MPEVTYIGLAALDALAMAAVEEAVTFSAEDLVGQQMAAAPVKTGTLRASIHVESIVRNGDGVTAITATGGESSKYAIFVHEGTGPHEIHPSAAQALFWPGAEHPVKVVHHPGTHPDPYMSDPLLANVPVYSEAMARAAAGVF
jgi:Bacteriophage HK97-gp10, putative tail-component